LGFRVDFIVDVVGKQAENVLAGIKFVSKAYDPDDCRKVADVLGCRGTLPGRQYDQDNQYYSRDEIQRIVCQKVQEIFDHGFTIL